jgi:hypothetical protein
LRWLLPAIGLSLLLFAGSIIGGRMLALPAAGAAVVTAIGLRRLHALALRPSGLQPALRRRAQRSWAALILMLAFQPGVVWLHLALNLENAQGLRAAANVAAPLRGDVVILRAAGRDLGIAWYLSFLRPDHSATWLLTPSLEPVRVTQTDPHTLVLDSDGEPWLGFSLAWAVRGRQQYLTVGERIILDGLIVTVLAVQDGQVTRASFQFAQALSSPTLHLTTLVRGKLVKLTPPGVGRSLRLASR